MIPAAASITGVEGAFDAFRDMAERHRSTHVADASMACRLLVAEDGNAAIETRLDASNGRSGSCYHVLRGDLAGELENAMAEFEGLCQGLTELP